MESFKKNKINDTNPVEVQAYFDSDNYPDSQIAKINELDRVIEEAESNVKLDQDSQDINSVNDRIAFRKSMKLQDDLEKAKNNKNTLIKEGVKEFDNENELQEVRELEDAVKMYPYLNKDESTISAIKRLKEEIEQKKSYIEDSDRPLDSDTQKLIEEGIKKREDEIKNLINSN